MDFLFHSLIYLSEILLLISNSLSYQNKETSGRKRRGSNLSVCLKLIGKCSPIFLQQIDCLFVFALNVYGRHTECLPIFFQQWQTLNRQSGRESDVGDFSNKYLEWKVAQWKWTWLQIKIKNNDRQWTEWGGGGGLREPGESEWWGKPGHQQGQGETCWGDNVIIV